MKPEHRHLAVTGRADEIMRSKFTKSYSPFADAFRYWQEWERLHVPPARWEVAHKKYSSMAKNIKRYFTKYYPPQFSVQNPVSLRDAPRFPGIGTALTEDDWKLLCRALTVWRWVDEWENSRRCVSRGCVGVWV